MTIIVQFGPLTSQTLHRTFFLSK